MRTVDEQVELVMQHNTTCEMSGGGDWVARNGAFPNLTGIAKTREAALASMRKKVTRAVSKRHAARAAVAKAEGK